VLIDDDKDEVATKPSSSPPISRTPDNNTDVNISPRSKHPSTPEPPRCAPAGSRVKSKPVSLPPMPTVSQATSTEKRRRPPVPPRKQSGTGDKPRECLDRDGYLECVFVPPIDNDDYDDVVDSVTESTEPQDSGHHRQTSSRRRRANSVDSLLDWQIKVTSLSDSESTIRCHRQRDCPPPPSCRPGRCRPPTTTLKFRGDLGLVPTNIASLSVEEVNDYPYRSIPSRRNYGI